MLPLPFVQWQHWQASRKKPAAHTSSALGRLLSLLAQAVGRRYQLSVGAAALPVFKQLAADIT